MFKTYATLIFLCVVNHTYGQSYEIINKVFKNIKSDSIFLDSNFLTVNNRLGKTEDYNKVNFSDWWQPIKIGDTPSIKPFYDNFDLSHFRADLEIQKNDSLIDFSKLSKRFIPSTKKYMSSNPKNTYFSVSKPYYNCSRNWLIIFVYSGNRLFDIGGGYMHIYRKVNDNWELYHKLELWIS